MDPISRLLNKIVIDPTTECWVWQGKQVNGGYGSFKIEGKDIRTHRYAYEYYVGRIPDGLVIDHLCRVRLCCNPAHLEVVTQGENIRRGETGKFTNGVKTHCPQGHPYDEGNTYRHRNRRYCRACAKARGK